MFKFLKNTKVSNWTLLVDDYSNRKDYHIISRFGISNGCVGNMASFNSLNEFSTEEIDAVIQMYETISD
jgi:hypothetical protein